MQKFNLRAFAAEARLQLKDILRQQSVTLGMEQPGLEALMEEAAYSWFSHAVALRYLEVNGYLQEAPRLCLWERFEALAPWGLGSLPEELPRLLPGDWEQITEKLLAPIPGEVWHQDVQLLGWLYQYYFSQKHEEVIDALRGKAIQKEDIPAATQLFTPDWVVRYLVDNSLGRYWLQREPASTLAATLEYLVVGKEGLSHIPQTVRPEELTFFDPCMGTGHILLYAFDVLLGIYRERGYSDAQAARSILEHNLFGLDIDDRAARLASFSILVKAAAYDPHILSSGITPRLMSLQEAPQPDTPLRERFRDAKELGSLIRVDPRELAHWEQAAEAQDAPLLAQARLLARKYRIVCTNPPYMSKIGGVLKPYINRHFKDYSADLFSVFLYRNFDFCTGDGYCAYMTPNVWMFIKVYEKLRRFLFSHKHITTLVQMAKGAFFKEASVDVCAFVLKNRPNPQPGLYLRLEDFRGTMEFQGQKVLEALKEPHCGYFYEASQDTFSCFPGSPAAYWLSPALATTFASGVSLGKLAHPCQGLATADNRRFLRLWFEIPLSRICFDCTAVDDPLVEKYKWFPYNKGGHYRKWYGNQDYIVNWEHNGYEIRHIFDERGRLRSRPQNTAYYFRECFSWSLVSSGVAAFRYKPAGQLFDIAGMSCFCDAHLYYLLALCNSRYAREVLELIAPTINYQCGDIAAIPVILDPRREEEINALVEENIRICRQDWDSFETSWDFSRHPLI